MPSTKEFKSLMSRDTRDEMYLACKHALLQLSYEWQSRERIAKEPDHRLKLNIFFPVLVNFLIKLNQRTNGRKVKEPFVY